MSAKYNLHVKADGSIETPAGYHFVRKEDDDTIVVGSCKSEDGILWLRPWCAVELGVALLAAADKLFPGCHPEMNRGTCSVAGRVRGIRVCHLPYQDAPFVTGTIDNPESPTGESNVWLKRDGSWSAVDGDPETSLAMGGWDLPDSDLTDSSTQPPIPEMKTDSNPTADQEAAQWAVIELMGHIRYGGMVSKDTQLGTPLLRVEVPQKDGSFVTQLVNPSSIYRITMCDETLGRAAADHGNSNPMNSWEVKHLLPGGVVSGDGGDDGDDDDQGY